MNITSLGTPRYDSPIRQTVNDADRVTVDLIGGPGRVATGQTLELAGPRDRLFFDPATTTAGIVTCGGLCPGLNNVIRSLMLEMHHTYGVRRVLGFRHGYQGLAPTPGNEPIELTCDMVDHIHRRGGTILGTSRGPVDISAAVEHLTRRGVNMLFTIGGDGTQRGALELFQHARSRGHAMAVVGIPKTIDNDVPFVSRTFGFLTAVQESVHTLECAHTEATSVDNGIALVKLMGRHAGFIAAGATIASQDVNFTLVPEIPFKLDGPGGFLAAVERRVQQRRHCLIVVAEGAGQDLVAASQQRDASGNVVLSDIGSLLRNRIEEHLKQRRIPATLRYFDPSYSIRSVATGAADSVLCDQFARHAVHAAMAGKTGLVIGLVHGEFVHVPVELLATQTKRLDPQSNLWRAVLATTGQPASFD